MAYQSFTRDELTSMARNQWPEGLDFIDVASMAANLMILTDALVIGVSDEARRMRAIFKAAKGLREEGRL